MSPSRGKCKLFGKRRYVRLAYIYAILCDSSCSWKPILTSADAFLLQAHPRPARRRASSAFVRVSHGNGFQPSPIATKKESATTIRPSSSSLKSSTNDNTDSKGGFSGLNNTDTTAGSSSLAADHHKQRRHEGGALVDADLETLNNRLGAMRAETIWESQVNGPPNAGFSPVEFVSAVLSALRKPDEPLPDSGFRALLRSSSKRWRESIRKSVHAPAKATEDNIAQALSRAMGSRSDSPFGLLGSAAGADDCVVNFPTDVLDFEDGTAWLECIFHRCGMDNIPLLATMWSLVQRETDGAWLIDDIEFHDLRKEGQYNAGFRG